MLAALTAVILTFTSPRDLDGRPCAGYALAIADSAGASLIELDNRPRLPGLPESLWVVQRVDTRPTLYRVLWRSAWGTWAPASNGVVAALGLAPDTVYRYKDRLAEHWAWTRTAGATHPGLDCPCGPVQTPAGFAIRGWVWRAYFPTADTVLGVLESATSLQERHRARLLELYGYVCRGGLCRDSLGRVVAL